MLLSKYTSRISELIIGTNLGGLGTLIASMASLISYRQISSGYPEQKGKYIMIFTICNLFFLLVLYSGLLGRSNICPKTVQADAENVVKKQFPSSA